MRLRRFSIWCGSIAALGLVARVGYEHATDMRPPALPRIELPAVETIGTVRRCGPSSLWRRGSIWQLALQGGPTQIGACHARLARNQMLHADAHMIRLLRHYLPSAVLRSLMVGFVRLKHRHADRAISSARRIEIAAQARAFGPDPYEWFLPTFERMVRYHSAYDVALSFEGSPMIGCSAFVAAGDATPDGHTVIGRNFDAELGSVFDRDKAVLLLRPEGAIPFASVAWPGLTGAVTGLNLEGLWVSVNGARAGEPSADGAPLVLLLRELLERASSVEEAIAIARQQQPMVSHMVLVADGDERQIAVIERTPTRFEVRRGRDLLAVTNHYETTLREDPKDAAVRQSTSTIERRKRLEELLTTARGRIDVATAVAILRDRRGAGGGSLPLGDRRAIDALIATHSVVADATARVLYVAEAPHTLGRYVRFDLNELLARDYDPADPEVRALAADPLLGSGEARRVIAAHDR